MKRAVLALVICLPLTSVALGGVMFYLAVNTTDTDVIDSSKAMSKTSWRESGQVEPIELPAEPAEQ